MSENKVIIEWIEKDGAFGIIIDPENLLLLASSYLINFLRKKYPNVLQECIKELSKSKNPISDVLAELLNDALTHGVKVKIKR